MFLKPFAYIQGLVENKVILSQNALRRVIEAYTYKTKHDICFLIFKCFFNNSYRHNFLK